MIYRILSQIKFGLPYLFADFLSRGLLGFINKLPNSNLRTLFSLKIAESKAKTGLVETTEQTKFFNFSSAFKEKLEGSDYDNVFFVDQPGIGGAKINRKVFYK